MVIIGKSSNTQLRSWVLDRKITHVSHTITSLWSHECRNVVDILNRTFRIWDDDADRKISYQEFVKGLSDFGASLTKTEAQQLFHSMDKNKSGNIEYDELLIALRV